MRKTNDGYIEYTKDERECAEALFIIGVREGAKMRWHEMMFWIGLVIFLMNLAVGGE